MSLVQLRKQVNRSLNCVLSLSKKP